MLTNRLAEGLLWRGFELSHRDTDAIMRGSPDIGQRAPAPETTQRHFIRLLTGREILARPRGASYLQVLIGVSMRTPQSLGLAI